MKYKYYLLPVNYGNKEYYMIGRYYTDDNKCTFGREFVTKFYRGKYSFGTAGNAKTYTEKTALKHIYKLSIGG